MTVLDDDGEESMPQKWIVYVDETGSFYPGDQPAYVVGWMTRADTIGRISELDVKLQQLAPWIQRPLHATYLWRPAWHGLCLLERKDEQTPAWLEELEVREKTLDALRAELAETWKERPAYKNAAQAVQDGREPAYRDIVSLGKNLPRNTRNLLTQIANVTLANLEGIIAELEINLGGDGGVAVLGGQTTATDNEAGDHYLTTLQSLVRAATWTLLDHLPEGSSATLEFAVAGLHIIQPNFGVRAPLSSPTLNTTITDALNGQRSFSLGSARVDVKGGQVHDFRTTNIPGLFVADFAANNLYRRLTGRRTIPLQVVNSDLYRHTSMSMQFKRNKPYAAAGTGWANQSIKNLLADVDSLPAPEEAAQWVKDATSQWRELFRADEWKEALR